MTTYRDAGVDIDAGEETLRRIKPLVRETFTRGVAADIGAFGAFFELGDGYDRPLLVSSVDGVGTKLKVAFRTGRHDTVGQDLVNHCVNDIAVCGASPLFFLDYFSTGTLDPDVAEAVVRSMASACKENECALIGGETAEMPGLYGEGEYDLAGAIVGVVEKAQIVDGSAIEAGDVLLGLPSNRPAHERLFAGSRRVIFALRSRGSPGGIGRTSIGEALLAVHRSYLRPIPRPARPRGGAGFRTRYRRRHSRPYAAHHPGGLTFDIDYDAWERPPLFQLIQDLGDVPEDDLRRTFNLGMGLLAVVPGSEADRAVRILENLREQPRKIGKICAL